MVFIINAARKLIDYLFGITGTEVSIFQHLKRIELSSPVEKVEWGRNDI